MAYKIVNDDSLTSVANAIRVKAEISGTLEFPDGFVSAIQNLSPSGNDFIITASNDEQGNFTIDKTFAEIKSAYQDGKRLVVCSTDYIVGYYEYVDTGTPSDDCFTIAVFGYNAQNDLVEVKYNYYSSSVIPDGPYTYYYPSGNATPSDVASGKTFINRSGRQTGTATPPSGTYSITENGTYDVTNFASADVNVSGGGGSVSVPPKDVNFYDYDGTVVDSYTSSEFAALSAMPANPSHDGLTAQGWNWSLADAKAYVAKYGRLNIGQMYVTTSGDTEIDIQLSIGRNKPYLGCCPNGTVDIDWGDGSAHDTLTGTSTSALKSIQHTYPDTGEMFTITLHMESGSLGFIGSSSSSTGSQVLYNGATVSTDGQRAYQNAVKAIRCGSHVTSISTYAFQNCYSLASLTIPECVTSISIYAFQNCYSLASLTIPEGVTSISTYAFSNCYSLASLTIPEGVTSISTYAFSSCRSLASLTIPEGVTGIGNNVFNGCYSLASLTIPESVAGTGTNAFSNCYSLASLTIPEGVTNIGNSAFSNCQSLAHLIFEPTTPPTVNSNAFGSLPSDLVVYVPAGTLSAYQSASNYSSIADKMVEMSA